MGTDMCEMLNNQISGKVDSWAIRWVYHQFKVDKYSVYPTRSKLLNIGTDASATNTIDNFNRFYTILDDSEKQVFNFDKSIELEDLYLKPFLKQYSYYTRIKYKFLNVLTIFIK